MRIVMLGQKTIPSREGGIEVVVEELATRMAKKGHEVTCFNRKRSPELNKRENYKNIRLKEVWTINKKGLAALTSSLSGSILAAAGAYDIVHFHAEGSGILLWLPKVFGKKCIMTVHGLDHQRAKWGKAAKAVIHYGEKIAVKYADEIIVLSKNMQKYFKDKYNRETRYIPNGIQAVKKREADLISKKFGLQKNGYILFLGRLVPEKGVHYLLEAYTEIKTEKKLIIAGASSDTDEYVCTLKKMAEGNKNIIFTGFVQGNLLEELYSNAYFYVLPSDVEGMPLSLLEAMSVGNCCLISDIEECTEVTQQHALVFKHGNKADLREKMQWLCEHPEVVEKYRNGTEEFICQKYHWDDVVKKTLEVYRGTIEKKNENFDD